MTLYLLRHTSVDCTPGICYGQTDVKLKDTFDSEMNYVADKLKNITFSRIYSSPLTRCVNLVKAVAPAGIRAEQDHRLKELDFGEWEMKYWDEISKTREAKLWFNDYVNTPCPGGESYMNLIGRVEGFLADLKKKHSTGNILIVTHAGVIHAFHSILNNIQPPDAFRLKIDYGDFVVFPV